MKKTLHLISFTLFVAFGSFGQDPTLNGLTLQDSATLANIPEWIKPVLEKSDIAKKYKIQMTCNPFYFELDLTGDKLMDIVFFVENTVDHTKGLMIINSGKNLAYIVGCGNPTELGASLHTMQSWLVYREKSIYNESKKTVPLKTPGILVKGKKETNMVVYWAKNKYKTFPSTNSAFKVGEAAK